MDKPKRIITHWTASDYDAAGELGHYHYLIELKIGEPYIPDDDTVRVVEDVPVENNMRRLSGLPATEYAAHTRNFNSYSIGVALCGMRAAKDFRPAGGVDPGTHPVTARQVRTLFALCAMLCKTYDLDPNDPTSLFTHYEAEALHGVDQNDKWDITWAPGLGLDKDKVGDWIRINTFYWLNNIDVEYGL